jgi:hypothetical protein
MVGWSHLLGREKEGWLKGFLDLPNGVPSHDPSVGSLSTWMPSNCCGRLGSIGTSRTVSIGCWILPFGKTRVESERGMSNKTWPP